ncbi:MAG: energy transducer TonB [Pseudomonadota bacterium]
MLRFILAGLLSSLLALGAAADRINDAIAAYNAVVNTSDTEAKLAAAEALGEAAMVAEERDDAALLAFEAAKTLCLANACEAAKPVANWALSKGGNFEDVPYEDFIVLSAYADWRVDDRRATRAALDKALTTIVKTEPSFMSVIIFQVRYAEDLADEKWARAALTAEQAAEHFEPVKAVIGQQWSNARTAAIASAFNDEPELDHLFAFASLERELNEIHSAHHEANGDAPHAAWLDTSRYTAQAWRLASEAYFKSTSHKASSEARSLEQQVEAIVSYENTDLQPSEMTGLPLCEGEFRMRPSLSYPSRAARRGQFGAVIMQLSLADGKVSSIEPLASVPADGFKDQATKTVSKWTWRTDVPKTDIGVACRMDKENIILPLIFALR